MAVSKDNLDTEPATATKLHRGFVQPDNSCLFAAVSFLCQGITGPRDLKAASRKLREICDRHGILLIADEVITGFGRTGAWSGSRLWGVQPDMMCTAKAITSGYFPLGAALINERIATAFESDSSGKAAIGHGYTYSGHPVGAAAALAAIAETRRLDVVTNAAARGTQLYDGMVSLAGRYPVVGDVRGGHGLMTAMELVADRETKAPIDGKLAIKMQKAAYQAGALIRVSGPNVILSPSLVIEEADIDIALNAVEEGLKAIS